MMRVVWVLAIAVTISGCGHTRIQWKYQDSDCRKKPQTSQKYSIKRLRWGADHEYVCANSPCKEPYLKQKVDYLYEFYPDVFSSNGVPICLAVDGKSSDAPPKGYARTGFDKFMYFMGCITLSVIPVNDVNYFNWEMVIESDARSQLGKRKVDCVSEQIWSFFPLGIFCFYSEGDYGDFRLTHGNIDSNGTHWFDEDRLRMEALGAGVAAELAAMEKDGRIKIGAKVEGDDVLSQPVASEEERARTLEIAKKTVVARRKELEDLKKAGIIDEAEFAAEMKKLEGAGK